MPQNYKYVLQHNLKQCLSNNSLDQATEVLQRLKEEDPVSLTTRGLELELLTKKERYKEATTLARQLVELHPASARVHYLAGMLYYRQKNYPVAKQHFSESMAIAPSWTLNRWLGKTLTQMGDFDDAEALLHPLQIDHPVCRLDLAWLYERKKEYFQALKQIDQYLIHFPNEEYVKNQQVRLRALTMPAEELLDEVSTLLDLGEDVSDNLKPEYIDNLFRTGHGKKARDYLNNLSAVNSKLATQLAWKCHRNQAYDLAFDLFTKSFVANCHNPKYLSALEYAAKQCGRIDDLINLYEAHADQEKKLYGRLNRMRN